MYTRLQTQYTVISKDFHACLRFRTQYVTRVTFNTEHQLYECLWTHYTNMDKDNQKSTLQFDSIDMWSMLAGRTTINILYAGFEVSWFLITGGF